MTIEDRDEKSLKQLRYRQSKRMKVSFLNWWLVFFRKVYTKAMEQLEKGHVWLVHSMKMLGIQPWSYVGFAIFPNIANRKTLEETGLFKIEDTSRVKDKKNIE